MTQRTNVRWLLAWFLFLPITLLMSLDRTAMTVAAPIIQEDMGFSLAQMSLILTAFHWAYALLAVPAGLFAAYFGARVALLIANVAWSLLTLAIPFSGGAGSMTAIRFLLGGFQAVDWPSSIASFRSWFPAAERSRANACLLAGTYLGPILGAPLTALLVADFGWRAAFIIFGALGVVSACAWWFIFRNEPRDHWAVSREEADYIEQGQDSDLLPKEKGSLRALAAQRAFYTIGLQGLCTGGVMGFFNTWLPTYLMQERGVALKSLGFFSSIPWMVLLTVVIIAAFVADRIYRLTGSAWKARVPAAVIGFLIAGGGMLLATRIEDTPAALLVLALALGGMGLVQVSTWSTIQHVGGRNTGLLTAWNGMLTNGGAAIGPALMALLAQRDGNWTVALVMVAATGVMGALAWTMIYPRKPEPRAAANPTS
jgi:ACS family glucarate transporter-like MFS transporter